MPKGRKQTGPDDEPEVVEDPDVVVDGPLATEREDEPEPKDEKSELQQLREDLAELRGMLGAQHRERVQPEPKPKKDDFDWENELLKDPKGTLQRLKREAVEEAEERLTARYQGARGEEVFWDNFYRDNPDLSRKDDHDLVAAVLQANTHKLGDLPVEAAARQLADLTRERIMRYAGKEGQKGGKKAVVEGANAPKPKAEPKDDNKVLTLSDIIKRRKEARRGGGKGVAA